MKSNLHVIKVCAPVYQAAQKLEVDYPGESTIAVSEAMMNALVNAGEREKARFWRAVWLYFMERDCVADTATLAEITP